MKYTPDTARTIICGVRRTVSIGVICGCICRPLRSPPPARPFYLPVSCLFFFCASEAGSTRPNTCWQQRQRPCGRKQPSASWHRSTTEAATGPVNRDSKQLRLLLRRRRRRRSRCRGELSPPAADDGSPGLASGGAASRLAFSSPRCFGVGRRTWSGRSTKRVKCTVYNNPETLVFFLFGLCW